MGEGTQKTIVIFIGIILCASLIYFVWTKKPATVKETEEANENAAVSFQEKYPHIKATFSEADYLAFADGIYQACDGWGTDEAMVVRNMVKCMNNLDWILLNKAYGIRDGKTLTSTLQGELNHHGLEVINKWFIEHGITARF